jgi:membrane associated rhomboid family serine protease
MGRRRVSVKIAIELPSAALRLWWPRSKHYGCQEGASPPFFVHFPTCNLRSWLAITQPGGVTGPRTKPLGPPLKREPLFNIPPVILAVLAVLAVVHFVRTHVLTDAKDIEFVLTFAFIPARYDASAVLGGVLPGGFGAQLWTFVTYSLIHADWTHFGVNAVWLLPFGSAVARRFGATRFIAFFAVTAAAGAAMHLATHAGEQSPVIGASAAISGTMAAAMRFAFQRGGPLGFWRQSDAAAYRVPAIPLAGVLRDPRVLAFLAVWFGINILFGLGSFPLTGMGAGQVVAWQAHIGGFLAGLILFSWFDPVPDEPLPSPPDDTSATQH